MYMFNTYYCNENTTIFVDMHLLKDVFRQTINYHTFTNDNDVKYYQINTYNFSQSLKPA